MVVSDLLNLREGVPTFYDYYVPIEPELSWLVSKQLDEASNASKKLMEVWRIPVPVCHTDGFL